MRTVRWSQNNIILWKIEHYNSVQDDEYQLANRFALKAKFQINNGWRDHYLLKGENWYRWKLDFFSVKKRLRSADKNNRFQNSFDSRSIYASQSATGNFFICLFIYAHYYDKGKKTFPIVEYECILANLHLGLI